MKSSRSWFKRIRLDRLLAVLVTGFLLVRFIGFVGKAVYYMVVPDHYEVHYVDHVVKPGENLFEIIQLYEDYYPQNWDVRDMVDITLSVNELYSSDYIMAGMHIYVPFATKGLPLTPRYRDSSYYPRLSPVYGNK